MQDSGGRCH